MRHKHADLIHAWAEGAEIEFEYQLGIWRSATDIPTWEPSVNYRIKPKKKPDVVTFCIAEPKRVITGNRQPDDNLKLTFCGVTGKLIKAEVI